ncbi:Glycosyltransferase involved in cell wall bisynthesis [Roseomonas rosea]|uniref:Glycosyltransferase involved in cell wall bisynthesis n=1 Tax=Muricoccus roseus TaxID=198092 RepID=A0A1M6C4X7_9PROT|nr:glycosyltransferase family 1 protein [Roseomonas rosea]SHI56097.1 Glycosyltransferase involved in cell wall bisynthesis [Roseomonas rosea]
MTLWLDVEDLFHYALRNPRPSGIQRLSFELYGGLQDLLGKDVRFCRHDPVGDSLRAVPWEAVQHLFSGMLEPASPNRMSAGAAKGRARRGLVRSFAERLPLAMRDPLFQAAAAQRTALAAQRAALSHGGRMLRATPSLLRGPACHAASGKIPPGEDLRSLARPGDVLGVLGSPWFHMDYSGFIVRAMGGTPIQTALLVYDLIPLVRPEWCDAGLVRVFSRWFCDFAPRADHLFAISDATARDIEAWAARDGVALKQPIHTLPIGTGFSGPRAEAAPALPAGLESGRYALVVSTIEARKNHLLAFRAWRRMLDEMGPEEVPTLVFAGRIGWLVQDLMQQIENSGHLGGKLVVVPDPTDAELVALYRHCRFTLFPSLYEGWGLPVTESLSFGKLCIASDRTSLPEAGGRFCLYIDPENFTDATEVIRRACTDDSLIAEREAAIRNGFQPVPWRRSAEVLAGHLGMLPG